MLSAVSRQDGDAAGGVERAEGEAVERRRLEVAQALTEASAMSATVMRRTWDRSCRRQTPLFSPSSPLTMSALTQTEDAKYLIGQNNNQPSVRSSRRSTLPVAVIGTCR